MALGTHVQGKNVIGTIKVSGEYVPIFCAKTLRFQRTWEEIETTNINSGKTRDFESGMGTGLMEVTGVTTVNNSAGQISIGTMMDFGEDGIKREYKITMTADNGGLLLITFWGIIIDASFDKQLPGYSQSYVTIRLCGAPLIGDITLPTGDYMIIADYWQTVNGQNYISGVSTGEYNNGLAQTLDPFDVILAVDVEGNAFAASLGTPTVGTAEFQFQASPTRIIFPSDLVFDGSQRVYVQWKRQV